MLGRTEPCATAVLKPERLYMNGRKPRAETLLRNATHPTSKGINVQRMITPKEFLAMRLLFPEARHRSSVLAGFLTCLLPNPPSHSQANSGKRCGWDMRRLTVAGTVPDLNRIPFSRRAAKRPTVTKSATKVMEFSGFRCQNLRKHGRKTRPPCSLRRRLNRRGVLSASPASQQAGCGKPEVMNHRAADAVMVHHDAEAFLE